MKTACMSYRRQLRSPEWIEKATALKREAGWKCELCRKQQGDAELSIHHTYYVSGLPLWKYPRCLLMCLCNACHVERQELEQRIYVNVADVLRDLTNDQVREQPIFTMFAL